jgi:IS4 transposase
LRWHKEKDIWIHIQQLPAESKKIGDIYKHGWQMETMFKRLKQNFSLKYFLEDNQNQHRDIDML